MRNYLLAASAAAALAFGAAPASAALTGFVDNPATNSADWAAAAGGLVVVNADFDGPDNGVLFVSGNFTRTSGSGPGQSNTSTGPVSSGEGPNLASGYFRSGAGPQAFTVTFDTAVSAAGFTTMDLFNPNGVNDIRLTFHSGVSGTGALLGSFTAANFNFQSNNRYFMGAVSDAVDIRSIRLEHFYGGADVFGVDNIVSVTRGAQPGVPEPGTWALMILGFGSAGAMLRRRSRALA